MNKWTVFFERCGLLGVVCGILIVAEPGYADSSDKLVLTLSEAGLAKFDAAAQAGQSPSQTADELVPLQKSKPRPVNLGCEVDVNQYGVDNNALSSRLTGECNFRYRY
ncbi:hypothetical protein [Methylomonas sp. LWB]|uniref:hypothetical protein n=1 Tax=Methylomonas sp. LWB TaxID=1905845 RepID=UPI000A620197|nr:hypothetical protein [Methylomonas sp. LWB]